MRVKVQRRASARGELQFGIYVKRWWFPFWVLVDYWLDEQVAIRHAETIKHPKPVEIT